MSNLINKIWFVFLSVCLAITIGTAFGAVSSGPGSAEEVCSLEIVEVEAAEKLLNRQRRRTNESTGRSRLSAIWLPLAVSPVASCGPNAANWMDSADTCEPRLRTEVFARIPRSDFPFLVSFGV